MSTPDWMPYLQRVRALVTDQGGALSHAAIVAREIGLPCVTGCQNATSTIRTGDRVEVNGDLGIVTAV
jgi:pyruvate,water dikinase